MPITAKTSSVEFEKVPVGNHIARCYSMVEIGTEDKDYQGEKKKAYVVRITWELPNEKKVFDQAKGEQPFTISKDYTLSMHEKANLRHDLQSWRGKAFTEEEAKAFDITKLIGIPCMLNVIHNVSKVNGNTYANIQGVTAIPKGLTPPPQINPSFVFSYDEWSDTKFSGLPEWLRKRIELTPEFQSRLNKSGVNQAPPPSEEEAWHEIDSSSNDDLPF